MGTTARGAARRQSQPAARRAAIAVPRAIRGRLLRKSIRAFRSSIAPPTDASVYAQETSRDVPSKTRGLDGFATSFPVGLLHPLQHAGLSRRSPVCPSSDIRPQSRIGPCRIFSKHSAALRHLPAHQHSTAANTEKIFRATDARQLRRVGSLLVPQAIDGVEIGR